jgi:hypothetical protein
MKKCIVTGIVNAREFHNGRQIHSSSTFYCLNGDIETNEDGDEVYITSRQKENSSESEDVIKLVKEMQPEIQEYIKNNKRYIEV